jgi:proline iminopeptidase
MRPATLIACLAILPPAASCASGAPPDAFVSFATDSGFVSADDGARLFYRTLGSGATDIVVPLGFYLEEALSPLAAPDRRLVFFDPRARGRSDAGDRSLLSLDRQVADLDAVRRGLGIDSMVLIGWSGLGMETAVYAMRHPDRVIRLVQLAPVAARDDPHNANAYRARGTRTDTAAFALVRRRRQSGDLADDEAAYCRALRDVTSRPSLADPAHLAALPDVCRHPNEYPDSLALVFPSLVGSFRGYDWRGDLPRLTMPRLVVHGRLDAFSLEGSREWVPAGANARLLVIENAAHFPFLEQPDEVIPALEVFLRGEWPRNVER